MNKNILSKFNLNYGKELEEENIKNIRKSRNIK